MTTKTANRPAAKDGSPATRVNDDKPSRVDVMLSTARGATWRETKLAFGRFRHQLYPVYALLALYAAGFVLHTFVRGVHLGSLPGTALVLAAGGIATYALWFATVQLGWRHTGHLATCLHAATLWLTAATAVGVTPPMPAWLVGIGAVLAMPWWWRYRVRPKRHIPEPLSEPEVIEGEVIDPRVLEWKAQVARPQGPLVGSVLSEIEELRGGWTGVIELARESTDEAMMVTRRVGAALRLKAGSITIEPTPDGELHLAKIMVLSENPLVELVRWTGPTLDLETGISVMGYYADGQPVRYRHFIPKFGPMHSLISGCTGSGKSVCVGQLLAEERHSGIIASIVIDPQRGQSLPDWQDNVVAFAGNIAEAQQLLLEIRARMYGRNALLATIEWTDKRGNRRKGIGAFTPMDPRHGLPMISVTIDEAQVVLKDPICRALIEEMIAMSRKCGIKFRLITQVPLLASLGNSTPIRDAVAAGNAIVLRTNSRINGYVAFNGALPVDPCMLPKVWPNGETTAGLGFALTPGSDRPSPMRIAFIDEDDLYVWATTGAYPALEAFDKSKVDVPPPAPAASPPAGVPDITPEAAEAAGKGEAAVLAGLQAIGGNVMLASLKEWISETMGTDAPGLRTISKALSDLLAQGRIVKVSHGVYRRVEAA